MKLFKSKKFIALFMVLVIMVFGLVAAQAGWDSVLEKEFTGETADMSVIWTNAAVGVEGNPYLSASYDLTETDLTYTFGGLYPGAKINWMSEQTNVGTIPVEYDTLVFTCDGIDQAVKDNIYLKLQYWITDDMGTPVGSASTVVEENYNDIGVAVNALLTGVELLPGDKLYIGIQGNTDGDFAEMYMHPGAGNETKGKSINIKFDIKYKVSTNINQP
jgi:hypothetical protein